MKRICVICRELKEINDFNDEHVIPDSLGGYYHTNKVCKKCNSELGHNVDNKLVNNFFSEMCRETLGIKGKSGNIPHPLTGTFVLSDDPTQRVKVELKNGRLTPTIITRIENTPEGYELTIDGSNIDKVRTIIEKKNKKLGKIGKIIRTELKKQECLCPSLTGNFTINLDELKMGLLKIAYEFTIDEIPSYFEDKMAIQIAEILKNADFSFPGVQFFSSGLLDKTQPALLENFIDIKGIDKHYIFLHQVKKNILLCCVNLFDMYFLVVKVSEKIYLNSCEFILGVNDIQAKTYKRYRGNELILAISEAGARGQKL